VPPQHNNEKENDEDGEAVYQNIYSCKWLFGKYLFYEMPSTENAINHEN
jgi:hypothetical protein